MIDKILMGIPPENILDNLWGATFNPFTAPLEPFPALFYSLVFIAVPTLIVGINTDHPTPPLLVLILGTLILSEFVEQPLGWVFKLTAGVFVGLLLYMLVAHGR